MARALDRAVQDQVIADLCAQMGIREVARKYRLSPSTVSAIRAEIKDRVQAAAPEVKRQLDELLLDALAASLEAQRRIAEVVSEPEYVRKQTAAANSDMFGALASHSVRLLEAASWAEADGEAPDG